MFDSLIERFAGSKYGRSQLFNPPVAAMSRDRFMELNEGRCMGLFDDQIRHDSFGDFYSFSGVANPSVLSAPVSLGALAPNVGKTTKVAVNPIYQYFVGDSDIELSLVARRFKLLAFAKGFADVEASFPVQNSGEVSELNCIGHSLHRLSERIAICLADNLQIGRERLSERAPARVMQ